MLEKMLSSKSKVKIVRALIENPKREFCLEDMVKATGLSFGTAHPALKDLVSVRTVVVRKVGRSTLYKINEKNPMFPELKKLFMREKTMMEDMANEFIAGIRKTEIKAIVLFGSAARGEVTEKSDIDLLFILRGDGKTKKEINDRSEEFLDMYDVEVVPTFLSVKDVKNRFKKADEFVLNVLAEGKELFGDLKWLKR
jgi:predicted nucleotidyltransferase